MITIKVRMDDGGAPEITISAIAEYYHSERDDLATSTMTVESPVARAYVDAIAAALQDAIDSVRGEAERVGRRGAIRSAAAAERAASHAEVVAARFLDFDTSSIHDGATISDGGTPEE